MPGGKTSRLREWQRSCCFGREQTQTGNTDCESTCGAKGKTLQPAVEHASLVDDDLKTEDKHCGNKHHIQILKAMIRKKSYISQSQMPT